MNAMAFEVGFDRPQKDIVFILGQTNFRRCWGLAYLHNGYIIVHKQRISLKKQKREFTRWLRGLKVQEGSFGFFNTKYWISEIKHSASDDNPNKC